MRVDLNPTGKMCDDEWKFLDFAIVPNECTVRPAAHEMGRLGGFALLFIGGLAKGLVGVSATGSVSRRGGGVALRASGCGLSSSLLESSAGEKMASMPGGNFWCRRNLRTTREGNQHLDRRKRAGQISMTCLTKDQNEKEDL
jgi:hypothetical protein